MHKNVAKSSFQSIREKYAASTFSKVSVLPPLP
jgi:hypothetical protein